MKLTIKQLKRLIKEQVESGMPEDKRSDLYKKSMDATHAYAKQKTGRQVPFTERKTQELLTVEIKFFLEDENDPDSIMYSFVQDTGGASGIDPVETLESMCEHWTAEAEDLARRLVDSNRE